MRGSEREREREARRHGGGGKNGDQKSRSGDLRDRVRGNVNPRFSRDLPSRGILNTIKVHRFATGGFPPCGPSESRIDLKFSSYLRTKRKIRILSEELPASKWPFLQLTQKVATPLYIVQSALMFFFCSTNNYFLPSICKIRFERENRINKITDKIYFSAVKWIIITNLTKNKI